MLSARGVFWVGGLASLALYAITLSSGYGFHDEAEYALRAYQLGATHSPGAPLYVLLAYAAALITGNPALSTGIVSALSTACATGLLAVLLRRRVSPVLALLGAALFAVNFLIWRNAVLSEPYALSLLCVAASVWLLLRWDESGREGVPAGALLLYAVALGAHFANILLLPGYALLLTLHGQSPAARFKSLAALIGVAGLAICVVAFANALLAQNHMPWDQNLPDSPMGMMRYMLGAQHEPLALRDPAFIAGRLIEHTAIIARQYLYIIPLLSAIGLIDGLRSDRFLSVVLGIVALIYLGYFTVFGSGDYYTMVAPAYFALSYWAVVGIDRVVKLCGDRRGHIAGAVLGVLVALAVWQQYPGRYQMAHQPQAPRYVGQVFDKLPADSLAVVRYTEFTAMRYAQEVDGLRPDLMLILPAQGARVYSHGFVDDYVDFVAANLCTRTVVTNRLDDRLRERFRVEGLPDLSDWYQLSGDCGGKSDDQP